MQKDFKRALSVFLAILMILSVLPFSGVLGFATEEPVEPSISVDPLFVSIPAGGKMNVNVTTLPAESSVTASSSDSTVANAFLGESSWYIRTGTKTGNATITFMTGEVSCTCTVTVVAAVSKVAIRADGVEVETLAIEKGTKKELTGVVFPADAQDGVIWLSDHPEIASVENGTVTAISQGVAVISCYSVQDPTKFAICTVSVSVPVEKIVMNPANWNLRLGQQKQLIAMVEPQGASDATLTWESSNPSAVTVTQNGLIKAVGPGSAIITATNGKLSDICEVTVLIPVTGIELKKKEASIYNNDKLTLEYEITPANASDKSVTWSSSDTSVLTVSNNGLVTPVGNGTATVTVKTTDGQYYDACVITVRTHATGVSLSEKSIEVEVGKKYMLKAEVVPETASDAELVWKTSDSSVATVSYGSVRVLKKGTATITVTVKGTAYSASCQVTGVIPVTGLIVDGSINTKVGEQVQVKASVTPTEASNQNLIWTSDNEEVATVDNNGYVIGVGNGETNIYVTSEENRDIYGKCTVTVTTDVTGITLEPSELTISIGQEAMLTATVLPETASNQKYTWKTSKPAIAQVTADGKVIGIAAGTAKITAKTDEGGKTAECVVTVTTPVSGVEVPKNLVLNISESKTLKATISPQDATNQAVTWSSADESIATVDESGLVIALKGGKTTITVTTADGGFTASCNVTVAIPVSGVSLNIKEIEMYVGGSFRLIETVSPANAANTSVTWMSDNPAVADVEAGYITALSNGTANIIVKTNDGGHEDKCFVSVSGTMGGVCGTNAIWSYDLEKGDLTISGSGMINDCVDSSASAWADYRASIKTLTISEGITYIGKNAFADMPNLTMAVLPSTMVSISSGAFKNCYNLNEIAIKSGLLSIGAEAFCNCSSLKSVILPETVMEISQGAFKNCDSMQRLTIENPNCEISTTEDTICFVSTTIYGYSGSTAQRYAKTYGRNFVSLGACMHRDNNNDLICDKCDECIIKNIQADGLKASSNDEKSLALTWNKIPAATGYLVYRYDSTQGKYLQFADVKKNTVSVTDLKANATVHLRVKAYKVLDGKQYFAKISEKYTTYTAPAVIKSVKVSSTDSTITVSWSKVSGATGYRIYQYDGANEKWDYYIKSTKSTSFTVKKLPANAKRYFKVRAYRTKDDVNYWATNSKSFRTYTSPAKAKAPTASAKTQNTITLKWSKVTGATNYRVYIYNPSLKKYETYKNVTTNSLKVTSLKKGTTYYFRVKAYRIDGANVYYGTASDKLKVATKK